MQLMSVLHYDNPWCSTLLNKKDSYTLSFSLYVTAITSDETPCNPIWQLHS